MILLVCLSNPLFNFLSALWKTFFFFLAHFLFLAEEIFKIINEAYHVLADDQKRAAYDKYGKEGVAAKGNVENYCFQVNFLFLPCKRFMYHLMACLQREDLIHSICWRRCLAETRFRTLLETSTFGKCSTCRWCLPWEVNDWGIEWLSELFEIVCVFFQMIMSAVGSKLNVLTQLRLFERLKWKTVCYCWIEIVCFFKKMILIYSNDYLSNRGANDRRPNAWKDASIC